MEENIIDNNGKKDKMVTLDLSLTGTFTRKSQVDDYRYRGPALHAMSFLDFITNTYEESLEKRKVRDKDKNDMDSEKIESENKHCHGQPKNLRCPYDALHIFHETCHRILRSPGHNVIANFIGPWVTKQSDEENQDFFSASMLLLLKLWKDIKSLKLPTQSWCEAYNEFLCTSSSSIMDMVGNLQFFYDCRDAATKDSEENHTIAGEQSHDF